MTAASEPTGRPSGFVLLGMPDVHGSVKGKALRPDAFEAALAARHGDDRPAARRSTRSTRRSPTTSASASARARAIWSCTPIPAHVRELTWLPGWRICLCTPMWPDGSPCELSSREALRGVLEQMTAQSATTCWRRSSTRFDCATPTIAPLSSGLSYSLGEVARFERFVARSCRRSRRSGSSCRRSTPKPAPGLLELNIAARRGTAGRRRRGVRQARGQGGRGLDGAARELSGQDPAGPGGIQRPRAPLVLGDDNNAFGPDDPGGELPEPFSAAIAGVLEHLPAASLMLNPTINSYKRLVPGWFAPVNVSWGLENRSCAVRAVRGDRPRALALGVPPAGRRRQPVPGAGGARRVGRRRDPRARHAAAPRCRATHLSATTCRRCPARSRARSRRSTPTADLRRIIGEEFCDYFRTSRAWELSAWREAVSDWERERYERTV